MTKKFRKFSVSLTPEMIAKIHQVTHDREMASPSELFRSLFNEYYEGKYRAKFMGYQSGLKTFDEKATKNKAKQDRAAKLAAIKKMSPLELTKFFIMTGFIKDPKPLFEGSSVMVGNTISERDGNIIFKEVHVDTGSDGNKYEVYSSDIYIGLDQIINAAEKQGLL